MRAAGRTDRLYVAHYFMAKMAGNVRRNGFYSKCSQPAMPVERAVSGVAADTNAVGRTAGESNYDPV